MEDRLATLDGPVDRRRIGDVTLDLLNPELIKVEVVPPGKAAHRQPTSPRECDQGAAQKSTAAGDQNLAQTRIAHGSFLVAHAASFSRKILAL